MEDFFQPLITVVIPVKPGGRVNAIEFIRKLDYPSDRLEVFVAEGNQPSRQRNEAVEKSKGDIIYFLDDDSCPDPENLKRLARHFGDKSVAIVGGPSITPESDSFIQHCFGSVFASPLGGAGIRNRYRRTGVVRETSEKELILCNLSFRADVYREFGGLNENLYPNEENELMERIEAAGHMLVHDPDLHIYRSQRKNVNAFLKQVLNYGRGRLEQTLIKPSAGSLIHFIPAFFVVYCVTLFFVDNNIYRIPMICYIALVLSFASWHASFDKITEGRKMRKFLVFSALYPLLHLGYGVGMIWGALKRFNQSDRSILKPVVRKIEW